MSIDHLTRPAAARPPAAPSPTFRHDRRASAAPRERLNVRFLFYLIAAGAVISALWCGIHWWQVRNNAAALLVQANVAEGQARPDRSARFLGLYVGLEPDDVEARARYGQTLDRMAGTPRAKAGVMAVFEQVLLRDPERHAIRRRLASLNVEAGQFDDALQHLGYLRKAVPDDAEIEEMMGRCHAGRGQYVLAVTDYRAALKLDPGRFDTALSLATLLRDRMGRPQDAEKLLTGLVQAQPQAYRARLTHAQYLQEGTPSEDALKAARAELDEALRLAPEEADVLLATARLAERRADGIQEARKYLQKLLDIAPQNRNGYEGLAELELRAGRPEEAMGALRRGLERHPDELGLLWNLANLVVQLGPPEEGEHLTGRLAQLGEAAPRLDFLGAALRLRRGDWSGARRDLEAVRPLLADSAKLMLQCDLLLARCDEALGDLDAQVLVCRRAVSLDPSQPGARLMLASALSKLGRGTEALDECKRLTELPLAPASGRLLMARLLILQNLRLAPDRRQWDRVKQILDEAGDAPETPLLRAEMLAAQKAMGEARAVLEAAKDKDPKRADLWFALGDLAVREGKPDEGLRLLDEAARQLGDSAALRLTRLRCLVAKTTKDEKSLTTLEDGLDHLPMDQQFQVLNGLAEFQARGGRTTEARRLWTDAAGLRPTDIDVRLRLFDLALQDGDDSQMKDALEAVRGLEGEGGSLGQYDEARRLIALATRGDKSGLAQARANLVDVEKRRPGWPRVPVCLGQIDEVEGHEARALENYMRAIDMGERQFEVLRRAVQLLYKAKRYTDAELVIQRLPEQAPVLGDLQRVAAEISLQTGDYNRALELADKAVAENSTNYQDYIWLGQVLWAASQRAEISTEQRRVIGIRAEKALWQGARLGDKAPDGWVALVQYLARVGATDRADEAIHEAEGKVSAEDAPLAFAQCYAALDRPDRARELFQSAVKARPEDVIVLRTAADFYLRTNDLVEAEACLRKVIGLGTKDAEAASWARSVLAVVLAASGDYQRSREAMKLVGLTDDKTQKAPPPSQSVEQERSMAAVLALKPGRREHLRAIEILERLAGRQALSREDRFLLVQLYEQVGKPQRAWDLMVPLLQAGGNPRYLAHAVGFLLDQNRFDEAEPWLADLEKLQKQSLPPRTVYLWARLLKGRGKGLDGVALLVKATAGKDAMTVLRAALLIENLGYAAEADDLYRRYAKEAKEPDAVLVLAQYLGRRKRTAEALDLCEGAWEKCRPAAVAEASLAILNASSGTEEQFGRLEKRLTAALEKQPDQSELVLCSAGLCEVRGRYDAAEAIYRKVLAREPRNAVAANNLAWILALREGKGDEALTYIGQAMDVLGPIPELLDTRALAYLAAGQADVALADLREALDRPGLDTKVRSSLYYHLIQAELRTGGRRQDVEKTWRDAAAQGLARDVVHPLERTAYDKLAGEMGRP